MIRNEAVIVMRSLTHAIKGKKLLYEYGIEAKVVKPDNSRTEKGCGYGISLDRSVAERANALLTENDLPPLNIK